MTKVKNLQLRQLIVRKCGIICVIVVFTLLSFYSQGDKARPKPAESSALQKDSEENSFYFLTGDQQRDRDLGEIDQKVINPLNFKVQNAVRHDRSLLRRSLRRKLRAARLSRRPVNSEINDRISSQAGNDLIRSKRQSNQKSNNKQRKSTTNSNTSTQSTNRGGNNKQQKGNNNKQSNNNQTNKQKKSNSNNQQNNKTTNKPAKANKPSQDKNNNGQNKNNAQNKNTSNGGNKNKPSGKGRDKREAAAGELVERRKRSDEDDEEETNGKSKEADNKPKTDEEPEEEVGENNEEEEPEEETEKEKEKNKKKTKEEEEEEERKKEEVEEEKFEEKERKAGKSEEEILKERAYNRKLAEAKKRKLRLNDDGEICTPNAYKEFPPDLFGHKWRGRGFIIVHILVTCYMFFCLAVVCDNYFLPSLEMCSSKLGLSNDVAGATFMAAGSSSPELFAAILGVFIAKSDVGTGTIVGSAIFNVLFVIGLCGVCAASVQLSWWPVARDSSYYCLTVFVLIVVAYDGQISTMESSFMLLLYVGYILTMHFNARIYQFVLAKINQYTTSEFSEKVMNMDANAGRNQIANNLGSSHYRSFQEEAYNLPNVTNILPPSQHLNKTSMFEAACHVIIQHNRLFRPLTRFRAAADLIMIQQRKIKISQYQPNNLGTLSRRDSVVSRSKMSITEDVDEYWRSVPNYQEQGPLLFGKWLVCAPLYAALHYTVPNCKKNTSMFMATFLVSIVWIALFSYLMVWMVTLIGYTFGISDAIMGITLLAAGTSVPDAYTSLHVAKMGQGDMAVSNSIGSNVFDILVGLALPFFIETAIIYPGTNASINSKGLFYAMILLFLSLVVTVYLFYMNSWVLNKKLGILMIIAYFVILLFCAILEFNIIDVKNPVLCDD